MFSSGIESWVILKAWLTASCFSFCVSDPHSLDSLTISKTSFWVILKLEDGKVSFLWRDYSDGDKEKIMTLDADEFIRRFLLHVLPDRFVKIRHYGLLANRNRKDNIALCRELLGSCKTETKGKDTPLTWQEHLLKISGVDITKCPVCKKGTMVMVEVLHPLRCNGPPEKCWYESHAQRNQCISIPMRKKVSFSPYRPIAWNPVFVFI